MMWKMTTFFVSNLWQFICHFQIKSLDLKLFAYTFKNELSSLCWNDFGDPRNELNRFQSLGLDGYFSDYPNTARSFLNGYEALEKITAAIHLDGVEWLEIDLNL